MSDQEIELWRKDHQRMEWLAKRDGVAAEDMGYGDYGYYFDDLRKDVDRYMKEEEEKKK